MRSIPLSPSSHAGQSERKSIQQYVGESGPFASNDVIGTIRRLRTLEEACERKSSSTSFYQLALEREKVSKQLETFYHVRAKADR